MSYDLFAFAAADPGLEAFGTEVRGDEIYIVAEAGHATINFPYWSTLDRESLVRTIRTAFGVMRETAGYTVLFDPQLGRPIDPERDAGALLESSSAGWS